MSEKIDKKENMHSIVDENGTFKFHYFARDTIGIELNKTLKRSRKIDREQVRRMMLKPFDNANQLQGVSEHLKATNGHYFRMLKYISNLMTFDYVLYPNVSAKKFENSDKLYKNFEQSAMYTKMMKIKHNFRYFLERMVTNGEVYVYKIEDKTSIIFKELPPTICRASMVEDNVMRYQINLKEINEASIEEYPKEIQSAWRRANNSKGSSQGDWYQVGENGVCFNAWGNFSKGFPMFSFMFDTLLGHEDTMDSFEDQLKLDALKLVHQKVPLNEENMPVMEKEIIQAYHDSTKRNLPKTVSIATNPLELQSINFDKNALRNKDGVTISEDNIFSTGGISKLLFNNVSASGEGLKKSALTDEMLMYPYLEQFANYINYELARLSGMPYSIKFLNTTYFNIDDKHTKAKEDLTIGGSRQVFFSTQGLEPIEAVNMLKMEQAIGFDDLLQPAKSSHTQGSDENDATDDKGGRPTQEEVTDAGDKTRENK